MQSMAAGLVARADEHLVERDPAPRPQHRGRQLDYSRNGMSILVLLLYSGYAVGKAAVRFRSSTVPL